MLTLSFGRRQFLYFAVVACLPLALQLTANPLVRVVVRVGGRMVDVFVACDLSSHDNSLLNFINLAIESSLLTSIKQCLPTTAIRFGPV